MCMLYVDRFCCQCKQNPAEIYHSATRLQLCKLEEFGKRFSYQILRLLDSKLIFTYFFQPYNFEYIFSLATNRCDLGSFSSVRGTILRIHIRLRKLRKQIVN